MYRDLTMKEISEQQIGQTLQVAGWVENIRDQRRIRDRSAGYVRCVTGGHP